MLNDDYQAALEFGQQGLNAAITPMDEFTAINNKANSPVLQKRLQEGVPLLEETRRRDAEKGCATLERSWSTARQKIAEPSKRLQPNVSATEQII